MRKTTGSASAEYQANFILFHTLRMNEVYRKCQ
jgi:hypothetical protein